jgi:hypothetical protein
VGAAVRAVYLPWLEEAAKRLQDAVKKVGGMPALQAASDAAADSGTCTVFVDGLRYDVAQRLRAKLDGLGTTTLTARWTSMPSVTASGKAWCSPVAGLVSGTAEDVEFEPRVAADGKPLSGHNFRKLLTDNSVQPLDKHETGDPRGRAWTESGDLDHYGHEHGVRLARDVDAQLAAVVERVQELRDAGWRRVRIVTDHGWLLVPGGLPKTELPKHQAETRWGRCAVLKDTAHGTPLTFGWDWCKDVQVAYAPGVSSFIAGADYAHGGKATACAFEGYVVRKDLVRTFSGASTRCPPTSSSSCWDATARPPTKQMGDWRSRRAAGMVQRQLQSSRTVRAGEEELFKARGA